MTVPSVSAAEYTFGSLGGEPIISAQSAIKAFAEKAGQGWSMSRFAGRANLFRTSLGFDHGSGCVLMARNRLNLLSTSEPLTLVLGSGSSGESVDLEGIYIRRAERIAPGASQSDDALYLVELVDSRYSLNRKRVNKRYNCRVPRSTADSYVTETLNSGTPWTWEEIIQDLWGSCDASIIGAYEKRPVGFDLSDLASTPENLRYEGVSAWSALNDVVARVGCAVVHDNISVTNFYLIRLGKMGNSDVGGVECDPPMWNQGGPGSLCGTSYSAGPTDRGQYTVTTGGACPVFTADLDGDSNPITGGDSLVSDDEILWGDITLPEYVVVWFPTEYGASQLTDELKGLGKWYPVAIKVSDGTVLPNDSIAADWYANPNSTEGQDDGRMIRPDFNPDSEIFRYETMTARFSSVTDTEPMNNDDCLNRAKEIARDLYRCLFDFAPMHDTYAGIKFWAGDGNQYIPGKAISEVVWSDLGGGVRTDIYRRLPRLMPEVAPVIQQAGSAPSRGSSTACGCCDAFDCIGLGSSPVNTCSQCASGASASYWADLGTWASYSSLGGDVELIYSSGCTWSSATRTISGGVYRWDLTQSGAATSLSLTHVSGSDPIDVAHHPASWVGSAPWSCRCEMKMKAVDPEKFPVSSAGLNAEICLTPVANNCSCCLEITGLPEVTGGCASVTGWKGTTPYRLKYDTTYVGYVPGCLFIKSTLTHSGDSTTEPGIYHASILWDKSGDLIGDGANVAYLSLGGVVTPGLLPPYRCILADGDTMCAGSHTFEKYPSALPFPARVSCDGGGTTSDVVTWPDTITVTPSDCGNPTTTTSTTSTTTASTTTGTTSTTTGTTSTTTGSTTTETTTSTTTASTTTGSTTTGSTTTSGCLPNKCTWTWYDGVWYLSTNECVAPCAACVTAPVFSGSSNGETATRDCEISI